MRPAFAALGALGLAVALGGCALLRDENPPPDTVVRGHAVARKACAACHAVEPAGDSPRPRAVGFASQEMQHIAGLEGRVAELTRRGHYGMPPLVLSAQDASDIVAYIESLADVDRGRRGKTRRP